MTARYGVCASQATTITGFGRDLILCGDEDEARGRLSCYSVAETDAAIAAGAASTTTPDLTAGTGWSLGPIASDTVTISGGVLTHVLQSGTRNQYNSASFTWPTGVVSYVAKIRLGMSSVDTSDNIRSRTYIDYGSLSPYISIELARGGVLSVHNGGTTFASVAGSSLTGDLWVAVEVRGTTVRVWTGTSASDTEPTSWIHRGTGTMSTLVDKPAPTQLLCITVNESGSNTSSAVTTTRRAISIRALPV